MPHFTNELRRRMAAGLHLGNSMGRCGLSNRISSTCTPKTRRFLFEVSAERWCTVFSRSLVAIDQLGLALPILLPPLLIAIGRLRQPTGLPLRRRRRLLLRLGHDLQHVQHLREFLRSLQPTVLY